MSEPLIVGAGSPLVDILVREDDSFLERLGSRKGGMTFVDPESIDMAVRDASAEPALVPGGSACNTLVGIAHLGGRARMIGRLGTDSLARVFKDGLARARVDGRLAEVETPTGRVLSVVTPDAQRTMFTYLGAAAEFDPGDLREDDFAGASVVHLEGYQLYLRPIVERVVALTRRAGARLSLDLASFEVVEHCREDLDRLIPEAVDILLANEDEAKAFTGKAEEAALEELAKLVDVAVVKLGRRGAILARGAERARVEALAVDAIDTTGAGDLWASGFLYGLAHGLSLAAAARLGAAVAAEVVQVIGASIPEEAWARLVAVRDRALAELS